MLPKSFVAIFFILLFNFNTFILCNKRNYQSLDNGEEYSGVINNTIEYIFTSNNSNLIIPSRVTVASNNASREYPLLVVIRQQRQVLSWQLPLLVDTKDGEIQFDTTSRTLCPDNLSNITNFRDKHEVHIPPAPLSISLSTSSIENITFSLKILLEVDFIIEEGVEKNVSVSASAPKIFFYQFSDQDNRTIDEADTVILRIDSDDDVCMFVSVQNNTCPVYDLEHDIRFEGFWETVDKRGGMTVPRSKFPTGFFIIFVSKSEDRECSGVAPHPGVINRNKHLRFSLTKGATQRDYITAVLITICIAVASHAVAWGILCLISRRKNRLPMTMDAVDAILQGGGIPTGEIQTPTSTILDEEILECDSSMDETEYDTITEAESERHIYRSKGVLFVADLARKPTKILQKKSYLYLWHVITVAVFYGLPVVQLVVTYQKVLSETGNQDLCYYNFLCAHPLGLLSDFNHVLSNVGYVVLGILFICLVNRRERWYNFSSDVNFDRQFGIPQHHGLFYAMGVALIMEGALSASYHVCPNHTNFQFDSSFMYVMAVLCMVKIYQNRHPDINATAYATFGALAVAICLGMIGILAGSVYFWVGFTVAHLVTCLLLTVQIYYMGCWKFDRGMCTRVFRSFLNDFRAGPVNIIKPVYKGRMALLLLGNVCNWALAIMGLLHHDRDFASYLLAIFMANTLLYTLFYIVMKVLHKEKVMLHVIAFIVLATVTWSAAMYFFINKSISWALTPAESRQYNQPCQLFKFYDPHDIWHFLSAAAMFFSFMILLTLDDDLTHIHRTKIHVF